MGDAYRPRSYGSDRGRIDDYYARDTYYDQPARYADPYAPYHGREPRDGYTFRGAAERQPNPEYYRPHNQFTFRAQGPPAPRFPPAEQYPPPHRPNRRPHEYIRGSEYNESRPIDQARQRHAQTQRGRGGYRGHTQRPAPYNRDILIAKRKTTPEQLEGMNMDGQTRFLDVVSVSSGGESGEVIDLTHDSDDGRVELPRKRAKFQAAGESTVPRWSNPDAYTALPPAENETLGAPKKDIVKTIRKAKTDVRSMDNGKNAVQENIDFIAFNFEDDDENADESDDSMELDNAEPTAVMSSGNSRGFSHRTDLHAKIPSAQLQPRSFTAINAGPQRYPGGELNYEDIPPPPPPDYVMPTDDELIAQYAHDGPSTKRKRGHGQPKAKGDIAAQRDLRLYEFVRPHDYEEAVRRDLIHRIERAIRESSAKGAESVSLHCFGSFAAGLYLPTADMDLVAVSPEYMNGRPAKFGQSATQMHRIRTHFEYIGVALPETVAVIARAKVPIIKFPDNMTGIKVDISFENDSGLVANKVFLRWKAQYPAMPVIVVLVKQLLAMRNLNEVYTGGIGGFTTICLVVSMMQLMPELQSNSVEPRLHYGELLMNFLDLYGNRLDFHTTGIRMDPPGYFNKHFDPAPKQNLDRLTIIDPNNPMNDISGGSYEIDAVLNTFRQASAALQRRLAQVHAGKKVEDSILGCMWGGNYTSFLRQREKLSVIHRGHADSPPPPPPPPPEPVKDHRAALEKTRREKKEAAAKYREKAKRDDANRTLHALPPRPSTAGQGDAGQNGNAVATAINHHQMSKRQSTKAQRLSKQSEAERKALALRKQAERNGPKTEEERKAAKRERKVAKRNETARQRAVEWRTAHPGVEMSKIKMTKQEARELDLRHGFPDSVSARRGLEN
ncbi:hypothetical protein LTR91_009298 [Friedmanniomyces endolithicus]|uniref:polynucleotide adenylyltransferase n=2 Tax=Friedmanniomyces endolithicus TaxID=329885 RepID=A0AAN6QTU5_9PEZI|nr:hypothetical protein LTS01_023093 [Friedmanniomyces endolithicus]KAK0989292.1 hypothetical protein LTR91_009298 [Friedmanniomyces endolithicus]